MSFAADLKRIAAKTQKRLDQVDRGVKIRMFNAVARSTRVDTGRMRGDWQVSVDAPAAGPSGEIDKTPQGAGGIRPEEIKKIDSFQNTFLTNTVPYVLKWEEIDGMVAKVVADFERLIASEAKR
jgi:hypothetical protein